MRPKAASRASAKYWIDVGTKELAKGGPDALTIDALCRKTQKTKGSFYAHFESHDAFVMALAESWRQSNTLDVITIAEQGQETRDRLERLNDVAIALNASLDQEMRRLATRSAHVSKVVAEVDRTRIAYLASLYAALGGFSDRECADLATIEYAAYVGLQQLNRKPAELKRLYVTFAKLVLRPR